MNPDQLNREYSEALQKLNYAKNFTPHKVGYYESIVTEIVTRQGKYKNAL